MPVPSPTAHPVEASIKSTACKSLVTPLVCDAQLVPPVVDFRIAPDSPTAQPVVELIKSAPRSQWVPPPVCATQSAPCAYDIKTTDNNSGTKIVLSRMIL